MLVMITAASLLLAFVTTFVAWRATLEERRRSAARVAALAAEIRSDASSDATVHDDDDATSVAHDEALFEGIAVDGGRSRLPAAITIAVFLVGIGAALVAVLTGSSPASRVGASAITRSVVPLELVGLSHERDGESLIVSGLIRNPSNGTRVSAVTAMVFLFGGDGQFRTSVRAPVEGDLGPGGEGRFRVVVPNARDIGRYRVSFRNERGILPHVDRRTPAPDARP